MKDTPSLDNNHNVYVVGAGFSADAGLPVVANFWSVLRDAHPWLVARTRTREAEAVAKVLDYRLSSASSAYLVNVDLENVEELFSLASLQMAEIEPEIRLAICATLDYASEKHKSSDLRIAITKDTGFVSPSRIVDNTGFDSNRFDCFRFSEYECGLGILLGHFFPNARGTNSFISFNYDMTIERTLASLGIQFDYRISPEETHREAIPVMKLHGSVNWARQPGTGPLEVFPSYADVLHQNLVPEIVPPTWRKSVSDELFKIWSASVATLRTATRLVFIGFSFPRADAHLKYLLAAGLQQNISLRQIVCINPDVAGPKARFEEIFRSDRRIIEKVEWLDMRFASIANDNNAISWRLERRQPGSEIYMRGL